MNAYPRGAPANLGAYLGVRLSLLLLVFVAACARPDSEHAPRGARFTTHPFAPGPPSVVFVMARWSMPAHLALRDLTAALEADPDAPELVMVDIDDEDVTDEIARVAGARPSGQGETFWVRDGAIVERIVGTGFTREAVRRNDARARRPTL